MYVYVWMYEEYESQSWILGDRLIVKGGEQPLVAGLFADDTVVG